MPRSPDTTRIDSGFAPVFAPLPPRLASSTRIFLAFPSYLVVFMTYALRSAPLTPARSPKERSRVVSLDRRRAMRREQRRAPAESVVVSLPSSHPDTPAAPQRAASVLSRVRRATTIASVTLVSATLAVYGGTVYSQQQWNRATGELDRLRQEERQLAIATEALRQHITNLATREVAAENAAPNNAGSTLYLEPASPRSVSVSPPPTPESPTDFPVAY